MTDESDVEDESKSRRHVLMRHESSSAMAPLSPTSQSNAHAVVQQFIKDVQPRHIRSRQKEHITAFAKWSDALHSANGCDGVALTMALSQRR